jgi:hypothetical protein
MQDSIPLKYYKKVADDIKKLESDLRKIGKRLPPNFLAFYGEILVCIKLAKKFGKKYYIKHKGGQSKYDIEIVSKADPKVKKRIEVKTSAFKKEYCGDGFGWAVDKKKCAKHNKEDLCYFDFLILVGIHKNGKKSFYVFRRKEVINAPSGRTKRFKKPCKRIVIPFKNINRKKIKPWDRNLRKNLHRYKGKWCKIES